MCPLWMDVGILCVVCCTDSRDTAELLARFWSALCFGKKLPDSFEDLKAQMGSIVKKKEVRKSVFTVEEVDGEGDLGYQGLEITNS